MKGLEDLKVGAKVIVGGAYSYCRIRQVEKVTKNMSWSKAISSARSLAG